MHTMEKTVVLPPLSDPRQVHMSFHLASEGHISISPNISLDIKITTCVSEKITNMKHVEV